MTRSRICAAGWTRPSTRARRGPSRSSTPGARRPRGSGSSCCSTPAPSWSSMSWPSTAAPSSGSPRAATTSHVSTTAPDVTKTVAGEAAGSEELGGARPHSAVSGNAHYLASDEADAIEYVKALLSYLPSNTLDEPVVYPVEEPLDITDADLELDSLIPDSANQPYDMHRVIEAVVADFLEVQALYAQNIVVGFGRVEGRPVGVVANQPMHFAGCLDIGASEKAARFVRPRDTFNLPALTSADVPAFLPGTAQDGEGIIR